MRFMHDFSFVSMHSFSFVLIVYGFAYVVVLGLVFGEQGRRASGHEDRSQVRIFPIRFWKSFGSLLSIYYC